MEVACKKKKEKRKEKKHEIEEEEKEKENKKATAYRGPRALVQGEQREDGAPDSNNEKEMEGEGLALPFLGLLRLLGGVDHKRVLEAIVRIILVLAGLKVWGCGCHEKGGLNPAVLQAVEAIPRR